MAVTTLGALDGLGLGECRRRDVSPHRCVMPVFLSTEVVHVPVEVQFRPSPRIRSLSTKPLGHGLTEAQLPSLLDFLSERKD